jgi:hypothetical protein
VAAGLLVVALAGTGGYLASTRSPDTTPGTATAGAAPSPSAAGVPASWATYEGDGWTIRYPEGWQVSTYRGQPQLRDPVTRRTVRVGPAAFAGSPLGVLTTTAASFSRSHTNYSQLALEQRGTDAAVWELTYSDGGADLHAADWAVVRGGKGFTVFTQAKQTDWYIAAPVLKTVVQSLRTR